MMSREASLLAAAIMQAAIMQRGGQDDSSQVIARANVLYRYLNGEVPGNACTAAEVKKVLENE